ncbi:hypothetical protein AB1Y20_007095 [Prymnesium parvum]|uniref:non-specific serine/threonine protein kinase n=1 Tax=Prymnesium parvum TaxID=97485 RepID=A0AB34J0Y6_PRYPA
MAELEAPPAQRGWLHKEGHDFRNWKRRWCVLQRGVLSYSSSSALDGASSVQGWFPLGGYGAESLPALTPRHMYAIRLHREAEERAPPPRAADGLPAARRKKHRTFVLTGEAAEEAATWLRALRRHIAFADAGGMMAEAGEEGGPGEKGGAVVEKGEEAEEKAEVGVEEAGSEEKRAEVVEEVVDGGEVASDWSEEAVEDEAAAESGEARLGEGRERLEDEKLGEEDGERESGEAAVSSRVRGLSYGLKAEECTPAEYFEAVDAHAAPPGEAKLTDARLEATLAATTLAATAASLSAASFVVARELGRGEFGHVLLVRRRRGGRPYAMKVLEKASVLSRKQVFIKRLQDELQALTLAPCNFLARLVYSFYDEQRIYLVMSYLPGGDLRRLLSRSGSLRLDRVRMYTAQVVVGVTHLHRFDFVWRDLKPDNVMLGPRGDACLVDFGLAKQISSPHGSLTFCGTPEYLAPEIVKCLDYKSNGYGKPVDWWALGVFVFELLTGKPPFTSRNVNAVLRMIASAEVPFPAVVKAARGGRPSPVAAVPEAARRFVLALMERDVSKRLGSSANDGLDKHEFMSGIDFDALQRDSGPSEADASDEVFEGEVARFAAPPTATVDPTNGAGDEDLSWFDQFVDPRASAMLSISK